MGRRIIKDILSSKTNWLQIIILCIVFLIPEIKQYICENGNDKFIIIQSVLTLLARNIQLIPKGNFDGEKISEEKS